MSATNSLHYKLCLEWAKWLHKNMIQERNSSGNLTGQKNNCLKNKIMKEVKLQVPDGKKVEWIDNVLTLVDEKKEEDLPITEIVKSYEDACKVIGEDPIDFGQKTVNPKICDIAETKLKTIIEALNEGWFPSFCKEEVRWYNYFCIWYPDELEDKDDKWKDDNGVCLFGGDADDGAGFGLGFVASNNAFSITNPNYAARLALKSEELAKYCARQFTALWGEYFTNQKCTPWREAVKNAEN